MLSLALALILTQTGQAPAMERLQGYHRALIPVVASTNLNKDSEALALSTSDRLGGGTVVADSTTAPDGTLTADTLVEDVSTGAHFSDQSISVTNGDSYTYSVSVKAGTRNWFYVLKSGGTAIRAYVNATTCALGTVGTFDAARVTGPDMFGFCRVVVSFSGGNVTGGGVFIGVGVATGDGVTSHTGAGGTLIVWGRQFEHRSAVTSYIRTGHNATASRAAGFK